MSTSDDLLTALKAACLNRRAVVYGTLIGLEGSGYRRVGARMLVLESGQTVGLISGGCLEAEISKKAKEVFINGSSAIVTFDLLSPHDGLLGYGLGCRGILKIYLEKLNPAELHDQDLMLLSRINPNPSETQNLETPFLQKNKTEDGILLIDPIKPQMRLTIVGAGEDAKPLVQFGKMLGWYVSIRDKRPALAKYERFPGVDKVECLPIEKIGEGLVEGPNHAVVIMSHMYEVDQAAMQQILPMNIPYVGMLGPKRRRVQMLAELGDDIKMTELMESRLYSPAGLTLGSETPEEIALAIIAEIQASLGGRKVQSLRDGEGPIHV